jgi:hypothetical protein
MAETRNAYETLVRNPEGMIPSVTLRVSWEDDIKMHTEIGLVSCGSRYGPIVG